MYIKSLVTALLVNTLVVEGAVLTLYNVSCLLPLAYVIYPPKKPILFTGFVILPLDHAARCELLTKPLPPRLLWTNTS